MAKHRKSAKKIQAGKAAAASRQRDENWEFIKAETCVKSVTGIEKVAYTNRYLDNSDDDFSLKSTASRGVRGNVSRPRSARAAALKMRLGEE